MTKINAEKEWEMNVSRLVAFKETHGHCHFLEVTPVDPVLGKWCRDQSKRIKAGVMPAEKMAMLDELGFKWNKHEANWNLFFKQLIQFKLDHGHCDVPKDYHDAKFGRWCYAQKKQKDLPSDKKAALIGVGFAVEVPKQKPGRSGKKKDLFDGQKANIGVVALSVTAAATLMAPSLG